MRIRLLSLGLIAAGAVALSATPALAGEPPNQNDPCASGGRNTCDTNGVGQYQRYRYGLRWFGDFRGAVAEVGRAATFCIDLRYWYPGKQFNYREISPDGLRNREGKAVPGEALARMSYAIWNFGRSNTPNQQSATMLYVHGLMDDAAPGEVAPDAIGPRVESIYRRMDAESRRLRGPYRMQMSLPTTLTVATQAEGSLTLSSATGAPMAGVDVTVASPDVTGLPPKVRTDAKGVARFRFTPTQAKRITVEATSEPLAAARPRIFAPTVPAAARNGQRLAAPNGEPVQAQVSRPAERGAVQITTNVVRTRLKVGEANQDRIRIAGAAPSLRAPVTVKLYGPFRTKEAISCTGTPAHESTFTTTAATTYTSDSTGPIARPGYYTYQLSMPETESYAAVTTPCGEPRETFVVTTAPTITSQVNAERIRPGQNLNTAVTVKNMNGESAVLAIEMFGPYPTREAANCAGEPAARYLVEVRGDGVYTSSNSTPQTPGYYIYRETLAPTALVEKAEIACGDPLETAVVVSTPKVTTQISAQATTPGSVISDTIVVTGLGSLTATINVELWGPYDSKEAMVCSGTPAWTGTVEAKGDGTYQSAEVKVTKTGYYTYRERIAEGPANDASITACGEATETTIVSATPDVTTTVSQAVVRPGSTIFDRVKVTGLGSTPATIRLALYGPFPTKAAIRCNVAPVWEGTINADKGDGLYVSPPARIEKAGFYTYREKLVGSTFVTETQGECGEAAETSLGAPAINTGRGAPATRNIRVAQTTNAAPNRVRIANIGVDAPVAPVGIDLAQGALDVPVNIDRTGWWRDGAAPGDANGTVLIAGHVDSARRGAGAFFRLKNARAGMRVAVTSTDGRTRTYRITSVSTMPKPQLPLGVFTTSGPARLALVTCGGPFDAASGHYRDNVVVMAVPT